MLNMPKLLGPFENGMLFYMTSAIKRSDIFFKLYFITIYFRQADITSDQHIVAHTMAQASELQGQILTFSRTYPPNSGNIVYSLQCGFLFLNVCIYKILHCLVHFRLFALYTQFMPLALRL